MPHQELGGLSIWSTGLTGTMRKNPNLENIAGTAIKMRRRAVVDFQSHQFLCCASPGADLTCSRLKKE